jgi:hypothetical protein
MPLDIPLRHEPRQTLPHCRGRDLQLDDEIAHRHRRPLTQQIDDHHVGGYDLVAHVSLSPVMEAVIV